MTSDPNVNAVWQLPKDDDPTRDYYYKSPTSLSHLLGMVTSNVVEYIRSAFPKDYFPTIWNSMEEPFSQRSKSFRDSMSKPRPALYIVPKFDPSDEPLFIPQSEFDPVVANHPLAENKIGIWNSSLITGYNNFMLYGKPRRYKMTFDLKYIFDSDIQRMQTQEYLRQSIRHKMQIVLHSWLENVIPTNYMKSIADINGFDYTSEEFLKYINTFSNFPITRRLRTGSGNMEFFAMMKTPMDLIFPDAPTPEGPTRKGNLIVNSAFSDSLIVEFCAFSVYFLVLSKNPGESIKYKDSTNNTNSDTMDMVGVDKLFLTEVPDPDYLNNGCIKYKQAGIQADKNGTDTINLFTSGIISDAVLVEMLNHYKDNKMPVDFIHLLVYEGTTLLDGTRIKFDRNTLDLEIKNMDIYQTYYICIYLDKNKMHKDVLSHFEPDMFGKI